VKPGTPHIDPIYTGVLQILNYYGLFSYPLLPEEIHRFHPLSCSLPEVESALAELKSSNRVWCSTDGFYCVEENESWSIERKAGNARALALLSRSMRFTRIIRSFPFVEAITISGSLSKYYAGKDADIDYFLITEKNRLWIARTLLHLFKKFTFIVGYQHYFCMNYFVDTRGLEITDKNIYTAIELATLIPVYNPHRITDLQDQNAWVKEHLPNWTCTNDTTYLQPQGKDFVKRMVEGMINRIGAERLNLFFMRLTDRKWRRKWSRKGFPMEDYDRAFHTSEHQSKNHPADFQKRILGALEKTAGNYGQ
jgi:hypothetical protein